MWESRTRRQALLQLLGLVRVLEDKGVQVALAADLELDLLRVGVLLDPGGYIEVSRWSRVCLSQALVGDFVVNLQEASFRRQISMNYLYARQQSSQVRNNGDSGPYLLDISDFLRHLVGLDWRCEVGY